MSLHKRQFKRRVFLSASLLSAAILAAIVVIPQWLSKQARLEVLRSHVAQIAQLAASVIDGDLHRELLDSTHHTPEKYAAAVAPLVRFHSANPDIFYVYTMVDRGGVTYFVLDTAGSPNLRSNRTLRPSAYMERFDLRKEYESDWLKQIAAGKTWVTPSFQEDDYGNFLTAHAPIYDSRGRYSGFTGVDFDLQYYLAQEARFRSIGAWSLVAALAVALLIGYLIARHYYTLHHRLEEHYNTSIRDGLTGLLNRRGMVNAIGKSLRRQTDSYATLLVDIDNLKPINDTRGHAAGDAVIAHVARAIGESIREGDDCARLGGDEFMIFAANCDVQCASDLALRILDRIASLEQPALTRPVPVTVSIGIAVREHARASFDSLYREADAALYRSKSQGKERFTVFEPSMTSPVTGQQLVDPDAAGGR